MVRVMSNAGWIGIPGHVLTRKFPTSDTTGKAWEGGYRTVRLHDTVLAMRVHTNTGKPHLWFSIGDWILTRAQYADQHALPQRTVGRRSVTFTHQAIFELAASTLLNIGLCGRAFDRSGGGVQAEWVSGPSPRAQQDIKGWWSSQVGHA